MQITTDAGRGDAKLLCVSYQGEEQEKRRMPQQNAARGFTRPTLDGTLSSQKRGAYGWHQDGHLSQVTGWALAGTW
ncbi:unnamed protein product [Fusarium equiseti]|uniref:Uncharacterized protein n=1 Tax=Fusarium equiseti TaxID=61235 RepID=A0A8J2NHH4_FUSEQ|nr:unnamed protein product [Fusarium equiseti]